MKVLMSSPTVEGLEKMLNRYFYSTSYKIRPALTITNSKGVYSAMQVKKKGSRYAVYEATEKQPKKAVKPVQKESAAKKCSSFGSSLRKSGSSSSAKSLRCNCKHRSKCK